MASAPKLKNKRLSAGDRENLKRFAKRQIAATQDRSELDAAYEAAAEAIHVALISRWPQKDMAVLAKYDVAQPDACVYIASDGTGYNYDQFCFREGDKRIVVRPNQRNCRSYPIRLEGDAEQAYLLFTKAKKADEAAVATRLADFKALIDNTASFNALVEVWPAADALRGEIVGHGAALSILSNDVVDRLKADPALELAA